jgi:hypothetical protein
MAYNQRDFNEKVLKFSGKSKRECYKLVWQWAKEKTISLSMFEALCDKISDSNKIVSLSPSSTIDEFHTGWNLLSEVSPPIGSTKENLLILSIRCPSGVAFPEHYLHYEVGFLSTPGIFVDSRYRYRIDNIERWALIKKPMDKISEVSIREKPEDLLRELLEAHRIENENSWFWENIDRINCVLDQYK